MTGTKRENHENRIKKIKFRAHHRGIQEMDIILGGFVDDQIADYSSEQLDDLEALMSETDADLLSWIIGQTPLEQSPFPKLLQIIADHQHKRVGSTK